MKIEFSPFIKSMSGVISRRTLHDGTVVSYMVSRTGRLSVRTSRPRTAPPTPSEQARRARFAVIASAVPRVMRLRQLPSDPLTRKRVWHELAHLYGMMRQNGVEPAAAQLAEGYCALLR